MFQKKTRILYVNTRFYGGGAEKIARQLYEGVQKDPRFETFFLEGRETEGSDWYIYPKRGFFKYINSVKSYISNNQRKVDEYAYKRIINIITTYEIDIIHFHNIHGNYMGIEDILEIQKYCKIVWTLHDMWLLTGHCAQPINCSKWIVEECNQCNRLDLYPMVRKDISNKMYKIKERVTKECNITYILPSRWIFEKCQDSFINEKDRLLIYNGINTTIYTPQRKDILRDKYNVKRDKFVIVMGSSDLKSSYKGMDIILEALERLEDKDRFSLVIFGNNEVKVGEEYEYHYMGYINDEIKMRDIYSLGDVFILPSIAETFGCAITESFAVGTPVIASNVGGISEQIDKDTGWLFESGNVLNLVEMINAAFESRDKLEKMGQRCREKVEKFFSENQMIELHKELYKRIVDSN